MAKSRAQAGFTVIELMVAVAVVSILLTVGVPAVGSLIERQQLSGAAQTSLQICAAPKATPLPRDRAVR